MTGGPMPGGAAGGAGTNAGANFPIYINFVQKGLDKVNQQVNGYASQMRRSLEMVGVAMSFKGLGEMAEQYTKINSLLKEITGSLDQSVIAQEKIASAANDARQAYADMVGYATKLEYINGGLFSGGVGDQATELSSVISKMVRVGGGSQALVQQMEQMMATQAQTGKMTVDQWKTITSTPELAEFRKAIIQHYGVEDIAGDPRKADVEVTQLMQSSRGDTANIADAYLERADEVNEKFLQLPYTMGDAINQIKNDWGAFVNDAQIAQVISSVAKALENSFRTALDVWGGILKAITQAVGGSENLQKVIEGILTALMVIAPILISFTVLHKTFTASVLLAEKITATFAALPGLITSIVALFEYIAYTLFPGMLVGLTTGILNAKTMIVAVLGGIKASFTSIGAIIPNIGASIKSGLTGGIRSFGAGVKSAALDVKNIGKAVKNVVTSSGKVNFTPAFSSLKMSVREAGNLGKTFAEAGKGLSGVMKVLGKLSFFITIILTVIEVISKSIGDIIGLVQSVFNVLKSGLSFVLTLFKPIIAVITAISDVVSDILSDIVSSFASNFAGLFNKGAELFDTLKEALSPIIDVISGILSGVIHLVGAFARLIISGAGLGIIRLLFKGIYFVIDLIIKGVKLLGSVIKTVADAIKEALSPILEMFDGINGIMEKLEGFLGIKSGNKDSKSDSSEESEESGSESSSSENSSSSNSASSAIPRAMQREYVASLRGTEDSDLTSIAGSVKSANYDAYNGQKVTQISVNPENAYNPEKKYSEEDSNKIISDTFENVGKQVGISKESSLEIPEDVTGETTSGIVIEQPSADVGENGYAKEQQEMTALAEKIASGDYGSGETTSGIVIEQPSADVGENGYAKEQQEMTALAEKIASGNYGSGETTSGIVIEQPNANVGENGYAVEQQAITELAEKMSSGNYGSGETTSGVKIEQNGSENVELLTAITVASGDAVKSLEGLGEEIARNNNSVMNDIGKSMTEYSKKFKTNIYDEQYKRLDTLNEKWKDLGDTMIDGMDKMKTSASAINSAATAFFGTVSRNATGASSVQDTIKQKLKDALNGDKNNSGDGSDSGESEIPASTPASTPTAETPTQNQSGEIGEPSTVTIDIQKYFEDLFSGIGLNLDFSEAFKGSDREDLAVGNAISDFVKTLKDSDFSDIGSLVNNLNEVIKGAKIDYEGDVLSRRAKMNHDIGPDLERKIDSLADKLVGNIGLSSAVAVLAGSSIRGDTATSAMLNALASTQRSSGINVTQNIQFSNEFNGDNAVQENAAESLSKQNSQMSDMMYQLARQIQQT